MCEYCPDPTPDEVAEVREAGRLTPADATPGRPKVRRFSGITAPCPVAAATNRFEGNRIVNVEGGHQTAHTARVMAAVEKIRERDQELLRRLAR